MTELRVGVVGLGYFSQFHLDAWRDIPQTKLVGVYDLDAATTEAIANKYGALGFVTAEQLAEQDLDIVDLVAPPPAHMELIKRFAKQGRTLICQKPFCSSLSEAKAACALAKERGCTLVIHENFRFQPWYREIKAAIDAGKLGQIYQARFALRPGDGRGEDAYLSRQPAFREMPRLLIHETGVHFVDLFQYLFGPITSVYADLVQLNPVLKGEDAGMLLTTHEGGTRAVMDGNRLMDHATDSPRRTMGELEIEGEKGTLRLNGMGEITFREFGQNELETIPVTAPIDETRFGGGCVRALCEHIVQATEGKVPFENQAEDYLSVISATEAAYTSADTGQKQYL
ncbi:Gfo/Idh/MocA family protein [Falsihalocynthiibacter sp. SS001]|uniref:Gfo/Idh/MocA family protein n=1 Tax=Falsihalocynthiibacter sp. SS001 TaxID=3349698 RepID=UPI0036D31D19